jgi:hypothetical protein
MKHIQKINEFNLFNKNNKQENKATLYLNAINNNEVTDLEPFNGYSNNGGIKFKLNGKNIILSVDRSGININVSGDDGGVMYSNEANVTSLIRKIDSIWEDR